MTNTKNLLCHLSALLLLQFTCSSGFGVDNDFVLQVTDANSSPTKLIFQTAAEFLRVGCGSHFNLSHIQVSDPLSGCSVSFPPAETTTPTTYNHGWILLVSGDEGECNIKTKFRNAANAGYSAIVVGTTKKFATIFQDLKGYHYYLDAYFVNLWDFKELVPKFAYPIAPDYASYVIPNPLLNLFVEHRNFCGKEREKPFYEREYYYRSYAKTAVLKFLEFVAKFLLMLIQLEGWFLETICDAVLAIYGTFMKKSVIQKIVIIGACTGAWFMWRKFGKIKQLKVSLAALQVAPPKCHQCKERKRVHKKLNEFRKAIQEFLSENFQCMICREVLLDGIETACQHRFCGGCIKRWRWEKNDCPLCRTQFQEQEEPIILDTVNQSIEQLVDLMQSRIKNERQSMRKEFQQMRPPQDWERLENLDRFEEFIRTMMFIRAAANRANLANENANSTDSGDD